MRLKEFTDVPPAAWIIAPKQRKAADKKREPIRQWLLTELAGSYFFPKDWLLQRVKLIGGEGNGLFGFCLQTTKGDPFFIASVEPDDAAQAEKQLREALRPRHLRGSDSAPTAPSKALASCVSEVIPMSATTFLSLKLSRSRTPKDS